MYSDLLVGSTGFVGGNLMVAHDFAAVCHSKDVAAQYGTAPDLCVYAGVPAAMFLANADPEADLAGHGRRPGKPAPHRAERAGAHLQHRRLCRQPRQK